jgi:hypothetical protein
VGTAGAPLRAAMRRRSPIKGMAYSSEEGHARSSSVSPRPHGWTELQMPYLPPAWMKHWPKYGAANDRIVHYTPQDNQLISQAL